MKLNEETHALFIIDYFCFRLKPKITVDTLALPDDPFDVDNEDDDVRFRRTGSERLKDGAKAVLRRLESIKSRRKKRHNRDGVVISGPQVRVNTCMLLVFLMNENKEYV